MILSSCGVVQINRQNYLLVTTTKDLVPQSSRLVKADPAQGLWQTLPGSVRNARLRRKAGSNRRSVATTTRYRHRSRSPAGCTSSPTTSTAASRRCYIGSRRRTSAIGPGGRAGHRALTVVGASRQPRCGVTMVGEISFTQIDGKAVLSYFNSSTGNMEVRVADDPTSLGSAPVTTVVQHDEWPEPAESLPVAVRQPAGPAVRRVHFAGFDAGRAAGVRQPVAQLRCAGAGAISGDPIRGQPVQTLVRALISPFRRDDGRVVVGPADGSGWVHGVVVVGHCSSLRNESVAETACCRRSQGRSSCQLDGRSFTWLGQ